MLSVSHSAEYDYATCCFTECNFTLIILLSVIMLSVIILNVIILSVVILSVIMLSATMLSLKLLNVVMPYHHFCVTMLNVIRILVIPNVNLAMCNSVSF